MKIFATRSELLSRIRKIDSMHWVIYLSNSEDNFECRYVVETDISAPASTHNYESAVTKTLLLPYAVGRHLY